MGRFECWLENLTKIAQLVFFSVTGNENTNIRRLVEKGEIELHPAAVGPIHEYQVQNFITKLKLE